MDYTIKHTIGYFDHTYSLHVLGKEVGLIQRPFRINYTSIAPKNKCEDFLNEEQKRLLRMIF